MFIKENQQKNHKLFVMDSKKEAIACVATASLLVRNLYFTTMLMILPGT